MVLWQSLWMLQRCRVSAGETHHIFIVIPIVIWDSSVRVAVPDCKLHGTAKGACNWWEEQANPREWIGKAHFHHHWGSTICAQHCVPHFSVNRCIPCSKVVEFLKQLASWSISQFTKYDLDIFLCCRLEEYTEEMTWAHCVCVDVKKAGGHILEGLFVMLVKRDNILQTQQSTQIIRLTLTKYRVSMLSLDCGLKWFYRTPE